MGSLLALLGRYRRDVALSIVGAVGEVVMEVFLPFIMASVIDRGVMGADLGAILRYGALMLVMAVLSLGFGVLSSYFSASTASGYAAELRSSIFDKVQTLAFSNIDKFGTAGLVTRMTTDVTNVLTAVLMVIRVAVRAPIMLVSSLVMCMTISLDLSPIFGVAIVFLVVVLGTIMFFATRFFDEVFSTYDDLNASVQENVGAIRVVKAFVREAYENEKFRAAAEKLYRLFVRAEGTVAFNNPAMMLAVYGCIMGISWFGAQLVVGGSLTTGELTSMFSYVMQVLMSLMMLSMIIVMITMSMASARRISEVLNEKSDIENPADAVTSVPDGRIDFDHVSFSYAKRRRRAGAQRH
ncbi:ABC transporter permease [Olsenella profusa]|uniref:ABC transporter permease n=1 Tax=Olsenella profusa TaxID=138595 RepID=UPI001EF712FB|nr:ABC transporter permease [Olsenella profusa]